MDDARQRGIDDALAILADEIAERLADRVAPRIAEIVSQGTPASPWLSTREAIAYSGLPAGTFRKLASCGRIPSHGGRAKLFYRPELDQALLGFSGLASETRELRSVQ